MHEDTVRLRELPPPTIHASWTALVRAFHAGVDEGLRPTPFILGAVAGLFLAYLGPFQTSQASAIQRYVYWPGVIIVGTLLGILVSAGVDAAFDREHRRPLIGAFLTAALMTPLGAVFVWAATRAVFGAAVMSYETLLGPVFLLSWSMAGLNQLARRRAPAPHQPASLTQATAPAAAVQFLERLPARLRGANLEAVEAEDHYLRIHTDLGSDLVLMRLSDAITQLTELDGAQTHRSWWVARSAVKDVRRANGRAVLVLPSGVEAPVSRSFASALRRRGWF